MEWQIKARLLVGKQATKNLQICVLHEINPLNWGTETKVVLNLKKTSIMEIKTVFSNERNTFDTVIESETLVMLGQATVGTSGNTFYGQIYTKSGEEYIGDYSQTNLSIANPSRMSYFLDAATLLVQLNSDVTAKAQEVAA